MARSIKLSSDQKADWARISRITPSDLGLIADAVLGLKEPILVASELMVVFEERVSSETGAALLRQLMSFCEMSRASRTDPAEVFDLLSRGLETSFSDEKETLENLSHIKPIFRKLVASESVRITEKTLYLVREHSSALLSSAVITDVRPIFDSERERIAGGIVVNYLKLEVFRDGTQEAMSFALDQADIDTLIAQLQDAKKKTTAIASLFADQLGLRSFVAGDDVVESS